MLIFDHVTKAFPGRGVVLRDLSVTVPAGTCAAVLGGNGAGKTTWMRCAAQLTRVTQGAVHWRYPPPKDGPGDAGGVAPAVYLGESDYLYGHAAVADNLELARRLGGRSHNTRDTVVAAWALAPWMGLRCGQLSRGQRRRVALARAELVARHLWLLDEPLAGLDAHGVDLLHAAMHRLTAGGGTVVCALQSAAYLPDVCTQVITLEPAIALASTHRWPASGGGRG